MLQRRGKGLETDQGEKIPDAASATNDSEERFFTENGEIKSSPAIIREREEGPTDRPMEGERRGVGVGGRKAVSLDIGLVRRRDFGPGFRERKQRSPPEEAAGMKEELGGRRVDRGRRYHERERGSRRKRKRGVVVVFGEKEKAAKEGRGGERRRWEWRKEGEKRREWMRRERRRKRKKAGGGRKRRIRSKSGGGRRRQR